jgi:hypothetical protein
MTTPIRDGNSLPLCPECEPPHDPNATRDVMAVCGLILGYDLPEPINVTWGWPSFLTMVQVREEHIDEWAAVLSDVTVSEPTIYGEPAWRRRVVTGRLPNGLRIKVVSAAPVELKAGAL